MQEINTRNYFRKTKIDSRMLQGMLLEQQKLDALAYVYQQHYRTFFQSPIEATSLEKVNTHYESTLLLFLILKRLGYKVQFCQTTLLPHQSSEPDVSSKPIYILAVTIAKKTFLLIPNFKEARPIPIENVSTTTRIQQTAQNYVIEIKNEEKWVPLIQTNLQPIAPQTAYFNTLSQTIVPLGRITQCSKGKAIAAQSTYSGFRGLFWNSEKRALQYEELKQGNYRSIEISTDCDELHAEKIRNLLT